ncbi:MAG: WecB/TagA/CpsF family glycosyltransferase, partial [Victivallaceae bacterium]
SNNSSLGEIVADAALTFDPGNVNEIAAAMEKLLTDESLRRSLRQRGLEREKEFDWAEHARNLVKTPSAYGELFGVKFSTDDMRGALNNLERMVKDGNKHFCAFVNADCFNQAYTNVAYRQILAQADMVWADGVGADIAARHLHTPVRGNVNGTDMLPHLCQSNYRIYLLGAAPGVAEQAKAKLLAEYPQCKIAGTHDGFFSESATEALIDEINQTRSDILLVAFGVPRQEFWIAKNLPRLQCKVAIGVGGLLDFASGRIPRAPQWLRKMRLEWTYRLYNEPIRLFKRYVIGNPLFLYRVFFRGGKYRLK